MTTTPSIYLLAGSPGVGKYTVARALHATIRSRGSEARIVDNHYLCNPIFGLVAQDGITPLPAAVWERVDEITTAVLRTIETLSPPSWSFIFTRVVTTEDLPRVRQLARLAQHRGAPFVVAYLDCELEELCRRVLDPARRSRMKSIDPDEARSLHRTGPPPLGEWNPLILDTTQLPAEEAATRILAHTAGSDPPAPS